MQMTAPESYFKERWKPPLLGYPWISQQRTFFVVRARKKDEGGI